MAEVQTNKKPCQVYRTHCLTAGVKKTPLLPLFVCLYVPAESFSLLSSSVVGNADGKISIWSLNKKKFQVFFTFLALFAVSLT